MNNPFWRVIRPTKSRYGFSGSIPKRLSAAVRIDFSVFVEVDAVVNHMHSRRLDIEQALDVALVSLETAMTASAISSAVFSTQSEKS